MDAVDVEHPSTPGSEPVVVVAVKNDRGVLINAGLLQQGFEIVARNDVAAHGVDKVGVPGKVDGAGNVAAFVNAGVDADFKYADVWIGEVFLQPIHGHQRAFVLRERHGGDHGDSDRSGQSCYVFGQGIHVVSPAFVAAPCRVSRSWQDC